MVVALTVTPALCLLLLSRGKLASKESPLMRGLKRAYAALLAPLIRKPLPAIAVTAALFLTGLAAVPTLGSQLLPNFKERDFLMHWLTQPGTSVTEETRVSISACKDLREIEGVRNCGSHIGQAYLADEVYGVDFGENWISVSPMSITTRPWKRCTALSRPTRDFIATCRPISGSASRRC
jgi:Cu/Ag efflux pump CusA